MRIGTALANGIKFGSIALSIVEDLPLKSKVSAWAQSGVKKADDWGVHLDYWGVIFQPS